MKFAGSRGRLCRFQKEPILILVSIRSPLSFGYKENGSFILVKWPGGNWCLSFQEHLVFEGRQHMGAQFSGTTNRTNRQSGQKGSAFRNNNGTSWYAGVGVVIQTSQKNFSSLGLDTDWYDAQTKNTACAIPESRGSLLIFRFPKAPESGFRGVASTELSGAFFITITSRFN